MDEKIASTLSSNSVAKSIGEISCLIGKLDATGWSGIVGTELSNSLLTEEKLFMDIFTAVHNGLHKKPGLDLSKREKMFLKLFEHKINNNILKKLEIDFCIVNLWNKI